MTINPNYKNAAVTITLHLLFCFFAICLSAHLKILMHLPDNTNIARFDTGFYNSIAYKGYFASHIDGGGNTGFFPLFPFFWWLLQTDFVGISIFNFIVTLFSVAWLGVELKLDRRNLLLFLSLPSFVFFYLPLSEATFFFFTTLIIIGLHRKNNYYIILGLFLASLVRPSSIVFVPAIILMQLLNLNERTLAERIKNSFFYSLASLMGLALVVMIQWQKTGILGVYFITQIKYAGRPLTIPQLPFVTWGMKNLWLDGFALWCGLLAAVVIMCLFIGKYIRRIKQPTVLKFPDEVLFSMFFIAGIAILNVLANPKIPDGRTTLMAENRYVIATSFFFVLMSYFISNIKMMKNISKLLFSSIIVMFFMLIDYHGFEGLKQMVLMRTDIVVVFWGLCFFSYISLFVFLAQKSKYSSEIQTALYVINLFLQIFCFNQFMLGEWIG